MGELQAELQRLSGTTLDTQGACNVWIDNPAPNPQMELVGCLNTKAGLTGFNMLALQGVLNYLAGTVGLGINAAATAITGGVFELLTEAGESLRTEAGDSLTTEH